MPDVIPKKQRVSTLVLRANLVLAGEGGQSGIHHQRAKEPIRALVAAEVAFVHFGGPTLFE